MFQLTKLYCVYVDYTTEDNPRVYYVGKGNQRRVNNLDRNELHTRIREKHGQNRKVVFESDDELEAIRKEEFLISEHRTYMHGGEGWWGANLTLGGEASPSTYPHVAIKISKSKMGHITSEETRKKISVSVRAIQSLPEVRTKMSEASKKRRHGEETRNKMKTSHKYRKPISEETRNKIRESAKNREKQKRLNDHRYVKHTDETKALLREKTLHWRAVKRFRSAARQYFLKRQYQSHQLPDPHQNQPRGPRHRK